MRKTRLSAAPGVRLVLTLACASALACLLATPALAGSEWKRNDAGGCVRVWNASELARGPIAMTNGLILPVRELVGGFKGGAAGIALSPISAVAGVFEGTGWIVSGLLDTLTGGAFAISPDGMARLRFEPVQLLPEGERSFDEYDNAPGCEGDVARPRESRAATSRPAGPRYQSPR
jgi:hypothetical protein